MRALVLSLLLASTVACAGVPRDVDRARTDLLSLQEKWAKARMAQDADYLERFYAPDFRVQAMDGSIVTREQDIANFRTKILKPDTILNEDMDVRVFGDAAVVTGVERVRGSYRGYPGNFALRFTNVYVRDGSTWRLALHQSTPINEAGANK